MSAFQLSDAHISYLVGALRATDASRYVDIPLPDGTTINAHDATPAQLGQYLTNVNDESVMYLYGNIIERAYTYSRSYGKEAYDLLDGVQILKAAACYEYQSCEHDGWQDSPASRLMEYLKSAAVHLLPGYDDAEWAIE